MRIYLIAGAMLAAFVSYLLWQLWAVSSALSASEQATIAATSERDRVIESNIANTEALRTLAANQALNNKYLTELAADLDKVQVKLADRTAARNKIEKEHPDVKSYLDTPIPAALRMSAE